jgi:5-methylcytosine-specific restriction endonuclease McrA
MPLQQPAGCSMQLVHDVVAERQNGVNASFWNGIEAEWRQRVEEYILHKGSSEFINRWPAVDSHRSKFLNLYSSPSDGSAQSVHLSDLRRHELPLCPACGEAGRPNTLDHFLPKQKYPHFCLTPLNLFPMCDACQMKKSDTSSALGSPRLFIHPYFDVFVAQQVIELSIEPPFSAPTFLLAPRDSLSSSERALVSTHMRELAIVERYAHFFLGQHRRVLRLVSSMRASSQDIEATLLGFRFDATAITPNSWEHIFYSAVLKNADLMDYLKNSVLPPYL